MARRFAWIFGAIYLVIALLEVLTRGTGGILFGTPIVSFGIVLNLLQWATGITLVLVAARSSDRVVRGIARIVALVFVNLLAWNLVDDDSFADAMLLNRDAPPLYVILHGVTVVAALVAGFAPNRSVSSRAREDLSG